jgi:hypothetical protein
VQWGSNISFLRFRAWFHTKNRANRSPSALKAKRALNGVAKYAVE